MAVSENKDQTLSDVELKDVSGAYGTEEKDKVRCPFCDVPVRKGLLQTHYEYCPKIRGNLLF